MRTGIMLAAGALAFGAVAVPAGLGSATDDVTPPSAPKILGLTHQAPGVVSVQWTPSTDNVDVERYEVLRNGVVVDTVVNDNLARIEDTLFGGSFDAPQGDSWFQVQAVDTSGNVSKRSAPERIYLDNTRPSAPRDAQIESYDSTTGCYVITYSYRDDDIRSPKANLLDRGSQGLGLDGEEEVIGADRWQGEDCVPADGAIYYLQLDINAGNFGRSVKTPPIQFQATARYAPTGFAVNPGTAGGYTANWDAPSPKVGATKFVVLNRLQPIAEVDAGARSVNLDLDPTRTHWLQLITIDEWGNESKRTAPIRIDPTSTEPGPDTAPTITVNAHMFWDANLNGVRDPGETGLRAGVLAALLQPEAEPRDLPQDQRGGTRAFLTPDSDGRASITFELFNFDDGARCNNLVFRWEPATNRPPEEQPAVSSATPPFTVFDRTQLVSGDICIGDSNQRREPGPTIDTDPFELDVTVAFAGTDPELRS